MPSLNSPRDQARALLEQALSVGVRGVLRDQIISALDAANVSPRADLLSSQYEAVRPGGELVDPKRPGFLARRNRTGVRLMYRHRCPVSNQQREILIGYLGAVSLSDARQTWEGLRAQRERGEVPALQAKPDSLSVGKLIRLYLDAAEPYLRASTLKMNGRILTRHLSGLAGMPAADVTGEHVGRIVGGMLQTPSEARKFISAVSTLYNAASGRSGDIPLHEPWLPRSHPNPAAGIPKPKESGRQYVHQDSVIRSYFAGLDRAPAEIRDVLKLQALTGCRINEVIGMDPGEISLSSGEWSIPGRRMKTGVWHLIYLSPAAVDILTAREVRRFVVNDRVVQKWIQDHRQMLGVPPGFTSHCVRHSLTTWAAERLYPVPVIDRCTAHTVKGIHAVYSSANLNAPARALWSDWAEFLQ